MSRRGSSGFHPPHSPGCTLNECHGISSRLGPPSPQPLPSSAAPRRLYLSPSSFLCLLSLGGFYCSPLVLDGTLLWVFLNTLRGSLPSFYKCFIFFPPLGLMIKISYKFIEDVFSI